PSAAPSSAAWSAQPLREQPTSTSCSPTRSARASRSASASAGMPRSSACLMLKVASRTSAPLCHASARLACPEKPAMVARLMDRQALLRAQLPSTLREADFPQLGSLYRGKVRDNYSSGDRIVMITTDRLSAFDRVLTTVPFKGELLNRLTVFWFEKTKDVTPNHILDVPDPSVLVVRKLQPLAVEMVVRGYLT